LVTSGILSLIACLKLADVGLATNLYSYPLAVEKILGKKSKFGLEVAIALTQFSFAISHIIFLISSCKSTVDSLFGVDSSSVTYLIAVVVIYSLLSYVRNLAKFSFTFMVGNFLIVLTVIYVMVYAGKMLGENGPGPDIHFFEASGYLNTLGFTIYVYEGIGIVMPVMATTEKPENFKAMLTYAFITLMSFFILFAMICSVAWGSNMDQAIVLQMLPADSVTVIIIKFLYSLNLVCSYPITICPANAAIEGWLCGCLKKDKTKLYWMQNLSRTLVTTAAAVLAVCLASKIDKFLGLIGSFLCAPLALFFPAMLHLKLLAKSKTDKFVDWMLIIVSILIFFFCSMQSILSWNSAGGAHG